MHDEAVQLKILQTALTLMQSSTLASNEVSASTVPLLLFSCVKSVKSKSAVHDTQTASLPCRRALVWSWESASGYSPIPGTQTV